VTCVAVDVVEPPLDEEEDDVDDDFLDDDFLDDDVALEAAGVLVDELVESVAPAVAFEDDVVFLAPRAMSAASTAVKPAAAAATARVRRLTRRLPASRASIARSRWFIGSPVVRVWMIR